MTNNNQINPTYFNCAALAFDLDLGTVKNVGGDIQRLSPINLKLVSYLVKHHGEVVSRTELFDAVWPNQIVSDDVLTRAISDIRTQLYKLDDSTKFIETLPKRGYRWAVGMAPAVLPIAVNTSQSLVASPEPQVTRAIRLKLMYGFMYMVAAMLLAFTIMWGLSQSATHQIRLAVLPILSYRPQTELIAKHLDVSLLTILRKNPNLKLLSTSAISSRPQNPFPYFSDEFDAKWVLECRLSDLESSYVVEMSLVDARTGLELRSLNVEAANLTELNTILAKKIEWDLLAEPLAY